MKCLNFLNEPHRTPSTSPFGNKARSKLLRLLPSEIRLAPNSFTKVTGLVANSFDFSLRKYGSLHSVLYETVEVS